MRNYKQDEKDFVEVIGDWFPFIVHIRLFLNGSALLSHYTYLVQRGSIRSGSTVVLGVLGDTLNTCRRLCTRHLSKFFGCQFSFISTAGAAEWDGLHSRFKPFWNCSWMSFMTNTHCYHMYQQVYATDGKDGGNIESWNVRKCDAISQCKLVVLAILLQWL